MRSFISRLRHERHGTKTKPGPVPGLGLQEAPEETAQQRIYRYRKQRGVNLGKHPLDASSKPVQVWPRLVVCFGAVDIRVTIQIGHRQWTK